MLKLRLISAAIMIPVVVYGVLNLPTHIFALVVALVFLAGMWEWSRLIPLASMPSRVLFLLLIACLFAAAYMLGIDRIAWPVLLAACAWWVMALAWVARPELCGSGGRMCHMLKTGAGIMAAVPAWVALVMLHGSYMHGPGLVLALMVTVWLADSGAYFAGRALGRHKLAPVVSPGKTWEGVMGGVVAGMLFAVILAWIHSSSTGWTVSVAVIALVTILFSVVGDLLESLMKRQSGIKDSSSLIPGHGGIFDRIDSLVAAAPMFAAGYIWMDL